MIVCCGDPVNRYSYLSKFGNSQLTLQIKASIGYIVGMGRYIGYILRKTIEGYVDSVPSLTFNTIKTLFIMHAFHSSRHLQLKWMLYFSHASMF